MERRTMSLEEECRYYDEQRQRINEWKELNAARLERKTLSDYIYSYEAEIQKMEEKGAPESLLDELRATRTELGTKLADAEDRIKRIEGLKTVNKNKSWPSPFWTAGWTKPKKIGWTPRHTSTWKPVSCGEYRHA